MLDVSFWQKLTLQMPRRDVRFFDPGCVKTHSTL
jgi:hypothetical protein